MVPRLNQKKQYLKGILTHLETKKWGSGGVRDRPKIIVKHIGMPEQIIVNDVSFEFRVDLFLHL